MSSYLFVTDQLSIGGAERHMAQLAAGLARRGHAVALASLKEGGALDPGVANVLCCASRGGLDLAAVGRLADFSDACSANVVVATSQYALMFATLARMKSRGGAALAFISHSMGVVQRGNAARLRFAVYRQFYRWADSVVFVSALQRDFFSAMGIRPRRSEVVHNGIDLAHFAPQDGAAKRRELGFEGGELVIGLCAVFREEKRHADMLEALALLRAAGVPARLLLIGDGPMRAEIQACSRRLGLGEAVVLAGYQQDVRPFVAACDVMALTSHTETFPIATLENMAMARPLVASDVGGMREQIEHGVNGLLYRAGDIAGLAAQLRRCLDRAERARLGQAALASVRARFDAERMVIRYETIFEELAQTRSAGMVQHAD